ncbi:alpha/beta hydrolase [Streptomyces lancefieldiae]|uniref:alpha/beta hydrolase n=1 Tax=Streptomyces lancefieldiae TaxID=3075520 RepID=UPI00374E0049
MRVSTSGDWTSRVVREDLVECPGVPARGVRVCGGAHRLLRRRVQARRCGGARSALLRAERALDGAGRLPHHQPRCVPSSEPGRHVPQFRTASPVCGDWMPRGLLQCTGWPVDGHAPEVAADGAGPILVIGNTGAPATPCEGAEKMSAPVPATAPDPLTRVHVTRSPSVNHQAARSLPSNLVAPSVPRLLVRLDDAGDGA